jgi:hypothetical protein
MRCGCVASHSHLYASRLVEIGIVMVDVDVDMERAATGWCFNWILVSMKHDQCCSCLPSDPFCCQRAETGFIARIRERECSDMPPGLTPRLRRRHVTRQQWKVSRAHEEHHRLCQIPVSLMLEVNMNARLSSRCSRLSLYKT